MKERPILKSFYIVSVYVIVFVALVVFQFSPQSSTHTHSIGFITAISNSPFTSRNTNTETRISLPGITIDISNGLELTMVDNSRIKMDLINVQTDDGILKCVFTDDHQLVFKQKGNTTTGVLSINGQNVLAAGLQVRGASEAQEFPFFMTEYNGSTVCTGFPADSAITGKNTVRVPVYSSQLPIVAVSGVKAETSALTVWADMAVNNHFISAYNNTIDEYSNTVYSYLSAAQNPVHGSWNIHGNNEVSSKLIAALGTAALETGRYSSVSAMLANSVKKNPQIQDYHTACFTGNLRATERSMRETRSGFLQRLHNFIDSGSLSLLEFHEASMHVSLSNDNQLLERYIEFLSSIIDNSDSQPENTIRAACLLNELSGLFPHNKDMQNQVHKAGAVDVAMNSTSTGIMLYNSDGSLDPVLTLLYGKLLQTGYFSEKKQCNLAGKILTRSVLHAADNTGSIIINNENRRIPPQDVYLHVPGLKYKPRQYFIGIPGGRASIISIGSPEEVTAAEGVFRVEFHLPTSQTEYILFHNVPRFQRIMFHDVYWVMDPQFEMYDSAFYYESEYEALYLKLLHGTYEEELTLHY